MIALHQVSPSAFVQKINVSKSEFQKVMDTYNVKLVTKNTNAPGKIAVWCWWRADFCHLPGGD